MKQEEKDYEIPFGAKDSELCGWEYTIPEGYIAEIKDGKVIVKKEELEDEKTRKEIIDYVIVTLNDESSSKDRWLAWLEKQCKENPLKGTLGDVFDDLRAGLDPSPKQGEQKPDKWSEEDELMFTAALQSLSTIGNFGTIEMQRDWLKSLKDRLK